jgi:hypothetical protein
VHVWVARLQPFNWYHQVGSGGARTVCGLPAALYGHVVPVGEALALADQPCAACFAPGRQPPIDRR